MHRFILDPDPRDVDDLVLTLPACGLHLASFGHEHADVRHDVAQIVSLIVHDASV